MPELPEVEAARRLADRHLVGRRVDRCHTVRDAMVYHGVTPDRVRRTVQGRRVLATGRKGKHLWLELDQRPWPTFHLGMTGSMHAYTAPGDRPRFWKLELRLDDGSRFAFRNVRRLGRIRLLGDPPSAPPIADLGFDPYTDMPTPAWFGERVRSRNCPIKALLLDQSFAAGVGNWIADEVLYHARIAPRRRCGSLTDTEIRALHRQLRRVIHTAVRVEADADRFPRTWLFHHRWGRPAHAVTSRGEPIAFDTVAGRTTAWVPSRQASAPKTDETRSPACRRAGYPAPGHGSTC